VILVRQIRLELAYIRQTGKRAGAVMIWETVSLLKEAVASGGMMVLLYNLTRSQCNCADSINESEHVLLLESDCISLLGEGSPC
jgi:hypothetical protein